LACSAVPWPSILAAMTGTVACQHGDAPIDYGGSGPPRRRGKLSRAALVAGAVALVLSAPRRGLRRSADAFLGIASRSVPNSRLAVSSAHMHSAATLSSLSRRYSPEDRYDDDDGAVGVAERWNDDEYEDQQGRGLSEDQGGRDYSYDQDRGADGSGSASRGDEPFRRDYKDRELKVGQQIHGTVQEFSRSGGAFVDIGHNAKAFLHINEFGKEGATDASEVLAVGQAIDGWVKRLRPDGGIELTLRQSKADVDDMHTGKHFRGIVAHFPHFGGVFVDIGAVREGYVPRREMSIEVFNFENEVVEIGDEIDVWVKRVDETRGIKMTMLRPRFPMSRLRLGQKLSGRIHKLDARGYAYVDTWTMNHGILSQSEILKEGYMLHEGQEVDVWVHSIKNYGGGGRLDTRFEVTMKEPTVDLKSLEKGMKLPGTVVDLAGFGGAFVDIGCACDAYLPAKMMEGYEDQVLSGQRVDVYIARISKDGKAVVSMHAKDDVREKVVEEDSTTLDEFQELELGQTLTGTVVEVFEGGYELNIKGRTRNAFMWPEAFGFGGLRKGARVEAWVTSVDQAVDASWTQAGCDWARGQNGFDGNEPSVGTFITVDDLAEILAAGGDLDSGLAAGFFSMPVYWTGFGVNWAAGEDGLADIMPIVGTMLTEKQLVFIEGAGGSLQSGVVAGYVAPDSQEVKVTMWRPEPHLEELPRENQKITAVVRNLPDFGGAFLAWSVRGKNEDGYLANAEMIKDSKANAKTAGFQVNQLLDVWVKTIKEDGKVDLTMFEPVETIEGELMVGQQIQGCIKSIPDFGGAFIDIGRSVRGYVPPKLLEKDARLGQKVDVWVAGLKADGKVELTMTEPEGAGPALQRVKKVRSTDPLRVGQLPTLMKEIQGVVQSFPAFGGVFLDVGAPNPGLLPGNQVDESGLFVRDASEVLNIGDVVKVKVSEVSDDAKIDLLRADTQELFVGQRIYAKVAEISEDGGADVDLGQGASGKTWGYGHLPAEELGNGRGNEAEEADPLGKYGGYFGQVATDDGSQPIESEAASLSAGDKVEVWVVRKPARGQKGGQPVLTRRKPAVDIRQLRVGQQIGGTLLRRVSTGGAQFDIGLAVPAFAEEDGTPSRMTEQELGTKSFTLWVKSISQYGVKVTAIDDTLQVGEQVKATLSGYEKSAMFFDLGQERTGVLRYHDVPDDFGVQEGESTMLWIKTVGVFFDLSTTPPEVEASGSEING